MRIRFDEDFDGYPWPGPLGQGDATFGEQWAGPQGLLGILETQLGLCGPAEPEAVRAAALVPAVRAIQGFWSASATVDPFGVARTLLKWRDALAAGGWAGEPVSERLADLAKLGEATLPGPVDRLGGVARLLPHRKTDLEILELVETRARHPRLWQAVFAGLEAGGARIVQIDAPPVASTGDLGASRERGFAPRGEGSLQLLRCQGPQVAADAVAAWLACLGSPMEAVIIGADPLLDAALRRHGLPSVGATAPGSHNSLLEVLPLVIDAAWSPADPDRVLELLTLPVGPVPRAVARRLVGALKQWPAVDSDAWRLALRAGLDAIEDPDRRARVTQRLGILLRPSVAGRAFPIAELQSRVFVLQGWLRGMEQVAEDTEPFAAAVSQCLNLLRLLALSQLKEITRPQLHRLLEDATRDVPPVHALPTHAGLFAVPVPGAVGGPAEHVIWWNFTRASATVPESLPLSKAERSALSAAGIGVPDPAQAAVTLNGRWGRPLRFARGKLLLACPKYGVDGERQHPHPLWDQISANAGSPAAVALLDVERPLFASPPAMAQASLLTKPRAAREWRLPKGVTIPPRETESPTGAGALIGCPFQWTVQYAGKIYGGDTAALPDHDRLVGNLAHEILARLLKSGLTDPAQAAQEAERLFDTEGVRLAAPLFMAGNEKAKQVSRTETSRAARSLFTHLRDAGLSVVAVEQTYEAQALGTKLEGRVDLVVGPPPVVIDLKWGGDSYRYSELERGAAFQLAAYSHLISAGGHVPPVAFFILRSQRMLTTRAGLFKALPVIQGAAPDEVFSAFARAYEARREELALGTIAAPGTRDEKGRLTPDESGLVDGTLALTPPCRFCELGALCGHGLPVNLEAV